MIQQNWFEQLVNIFTQLKHIKFLSVVDKNLYFKDIKSEVTDTFLLCNGIVNVVFILIIIMVIFNFIFYFLPNTNHFVVRITKITNFFFLFIIYILLLLKFFLIFKAEQHFGSTLYLQKEINIEQFKNLENLEHINVFCSSFGDAIIILSFITGIICLILFGSKNISNNFNNFNIFYLFNFSIIIMTNTTNLLIVFLAFEFLFLPTIYYVYKFGYMKKTDIANEYLLKWTLFGSFLILSTLSYLYLQYNTLNYILLSNQKFSSWELNLLLIIFLIGFGIKIPLAPFHIWLLKVHVESPTAFSIFLSGFLVKSALYCLFMFLSILNSKILTSILCVWIFISLVVGTYGLSNQTDIKKLIAWATIQEMTFMLIFIVFKQLLLNHACIIFIILHGLMSTYMFYLVDILQKRFQTRVISVVRGTSLYLPNLSKYIWVLILFFSGFPITVKFFIEWNLIMLMIESSFSILICIVLIVNFLGSIFFCKAMLMLLYGAPDVTNKETPEIFVDISKLDYQILNLLTFFMFSLLSILFFF